MAFDLNNLGDLDLEEDKNNTSETDIPALVDIEKDGITKEEKTPKENIKADFINEPKSQTSTGFLKELFGNRKAKAIKEFKSDNLEVNLVKDQIVRYFDWQKGMFLFLIWMFISLVIISLCYWGIFWWKTNNLSVENGQYTDRYIKLTRDIKTANNQVPEIFYFQKISMDKFLLDRHIYWTNFFDFLENNTLSNIYFSGFSGSVAGDYTLLATTNNIDAVNAQVQKLLANKPIVKNVQVSSTSVSEENNKKTVSFSMSFSLDRKIFLK